MKRLLLLALVMLFSVGHIFATCKEIKNSIVYVKNLDGLSCDSRKELAFEHLEDNTNLTGVGVDSIKKFLDFDNAYCIGNRVWYNIKNDQQVVDATSIS